MKIVMPNQLDFKNPGGWPLIPYQILAWVFIAIAMYFLYGKFAKQEKEELIASQEQEIGNLKKEHDEKYLVTLDLKLYEKYAEDLKEIFKGLLVYLPSDLEMPNLIDNTAENARNNGIQFERFQPEGDQKDEFYNIKPIKLEAESGFYNTINFVQSISALDRILNIADINMEDTNDSTRKESVLDVDSQLVSYVYTGDLKKFLGEDAQKIIEELKKRQSKSKQSFDENYDGFQPTNNGAFEPSETFEQNDLNEGGVDQ